MRKSTIDFLIFTNKAKGATAEDFPEVQTEADAKAKASDGAMLRGPG